MGELKGMRERIRKEIKEQGCYVGEQMEEIKKEIRELRERETKWAEEREEINGRMEELERRMKGWKTS